jgi:hypothetical protein
LAKKKIYKLIGEKMIKTAINFDESLVEILKIEVKRLKKLARNSNSTEAFEELQKTNNLIRNIILALTITDERIRIGIDLCMDDNET